MYRTIFETEAEVEQFLSDVCDMEWNVQQDAGCSLAGATAQRQAKFPQWKEEIAAYYGRWEEMLGGPIAGTVELLQKLVANENYKVVALTNWSAETFPIAQARYDFLGWFEGIVVSGEEKCIKPFPEIYKILFERYELVPKESLFIDDNPDNVLASEVLGMPAIRFENPEQLTGELLKRKVIV